MNALPVALAAIVAAAAPIAASQPPSTPVTHGPAGFASDRRPLAFEPNAGQTDASVRFLLRSRGGTFFFTPDGMLLGRQAKGASAPPLRMRFVGANAFPRIDGRVLLPGKVNHLIGKDPAKWRTGLPTYSGIEYADLYPGVTLAYGGNGSPLKGTYTVAAKTDPGVIRWRYEGGGARLDEAGRLQVQAAGDTGATLTEDAPVAWQDIEGRRVPVAARYVPGADGSVGFVLGEYDRGRSLTIDPVISYSTYLGGSLFDIAWSMAVDRAGNAYIAGQAESPNFPMVQAHQPGAGGQGDGFVAKFAPDGTPVYSTYLGGDYVDYVSDIAVDGEGNAYVTGFTGSSDFPAVNAFQPTYAGGWDAFVAKISPDGSALVYASYLGGSGEENYINAGVPGGIAVDRKGYAFVTGNTQSADFPTVNPFQPALHGTVDAFVTKVSATGTSLVYSTFLGGERGDSGWAIAVDRDGGYAVVTGDTTSFGFPTANAYQEQCAPSFALCWDVFVTRLSPDGASLVFSTYLGGNDQEYVDRAMGVDIDAKGVAHVTGFTGSPNFPVSNAYQPFYGGQIDAFVALFTRKGALLSSTFIGGSNSEVGYAIAVDGTGAPSPGVHVAGLTLSQDFPVLNPIQATLGGFEDPFVVKFTPDILRLSYSTYLGGSNGREEYGATGIGVDGAGNVYICGGTEASDFPTVHPYQSVPHGSYDAFLTRIKAVAGR